LVGWREILWRRLAEDFREMVSSKRWSPGGKSREPFSAKLLAMVFLAAKRRFPVLTLVGERDFSDVFEMTAA
jgi:hypothetical protein